MRPISGIQPPARPPSPFGPVGKSASPSESFRIGQTGAAGAAGGASEASSFGSFLTDQVKSVNTMQMDANDMVHSMLTGGNVNEAEVLTAVQKADLAFRMMLQVRNKLIEAYREVQQIQI